MLSLDHFFGSIGEQAFQTFFVCLAVRFDCLKILKAGAPILPKKSYGLGLSFHLCSINYYQEPDLGNDGSILDLQGFLLYPDKINVTAFDHDTITVVAG